MLLVQIVAEFNYIYVCFKCY